MANKKITINDLANMVKKGFDGVDEKFEKIDEKFEKIDEKFEQVATKDQIKKLEKRLDIMDEKFGGINKLETRVEYIENILDLHTKKV